MSYQPKPIDLLLPLNQIPEIVEAIKSFNKDWLKYHYLSEDLILYHYTTCGGLKGILDSRSIWCSHIKYFSDPQEWIYGERIVISKIEKLLSDEKDPNIKELLENFRMFIKSLTLSFYDIYAACFCKDGNLLSQWRSYSNKGGGYSLGFTFDSNTKITYDFENMDYSKLSVLRKIIYDVKTQNLLIDEALTKLIESGRSAIIRMLKNENSLQIGFINQMAMGFANRLVEVIISMKNPVFEREDEWRLIIFKRKFDSQKEVEFREKNEELIPYLPASIYTEKEKKLIFPINSIRIGPGLDTEKVRYSLELLNKNHSEISTDIQINAKVEILDAGYTLRN